MQLPLATVPCAVRVVKSPEQMVVRENRGGFKIHVQCRVPVPLPLIAAAMDRTAVNHFVPVKAAGNRMLLSYKPSKKRRSFWLFACSMAK